jgi:hypothetical protein
MQCVKCHDHKYDPVSQADYYRMRAVFEPYHIRLDPVPGQPDFEKDGLPRVFDLHLDRPTFIHKRGDEKNEDKSRPMAPGVPEVVSFAEFQPKPIAVPALARLPILRPFVIADQLRLAEGDLAASRSGLDTARQKLQELLVTPEPPKPDLAKAETSLAIAEWSASMAQTKPVAIASASAADKARLSKAVLAFYPAAAATAAKASAELNVAKAERELAQAKLAALTAPPAKPEVPAKKLKAAEEALAKARKAAEEPGDQYTPLRASLKAQEGPEDKTNADFQAYPATSTGRRLALAKWIGDERNPLTARVLVNHVWTRHFGASLVPDVTDYGRRCPPPLHEDLLDTLAVDFMQHGWSMKRLHRAMVLSQLYRRSSSNADAEPATLAADPDNTCYWRMNPRRLESQTIRDAMLQVAGLLDRTMGGPSIDSKKEETSRRRAIYFSQTADVEHPFLAAFDNSSVLECYRRQESIVPQQALALSNSKLSRECANALATQMAAHSDAVFIDESFLAMLGRVPTNDERTVCLETLAELIQLKSENPRALLLQALINHNDFITLR